MTQNAEARLDDNTLIVRISRRFQPRGGRNRIVAPDGWRDRADHEAAA
jgi:hypothetical protein